MRSVGLLCASLLTAAGIAGAEAPRSFDVQGHRGARGLAPENTLPGFARAIALDVDTLELDVGVTRDGQVIVAHDPFVNPALCLSPTGDRLAGERGPLLRHLDLRELQAFDCGSLNPDPERFPEPPRVNAPGAVMPSLREVIALVREKAPPGLRLNVEVKTQPGSDDTVPLEAFVTTVVTLLREEGMLGRATLQAFDWRALQLAKQLQPKLHTAALVWQLDPAWQAGLGTAEQGDLLGMLQAADPWIDTFSPWWKLLVPGEEFAGHGVADYQSAGFPVIPWTVNDPTLMRRLIAEGVDGLITDYPDRLKRVLAEQTTPNKNPDPNSREGAAAAGPSAAK